MNKYSDINYDGPAQDTVNVELESFYHILIWLEGYKIGKGGNIGPLGTASLDNLWNAWRFLKGHYGYECQEFEKNKKI